MSSPTWGSAWVVPRDGREAHKQRHQMAAVLREMANKIDDGKILFLAGDVVEISVSREPPQEPRTTPRVRRQRRKV